MFVLTALLMLKKNLHASNAKQILFVKKFHIWVQLYAKNLIMIINS